MAKCCRILWYSGTNDFKTLTVNSAEVGSDDQEKVALSIPFDQQNSLKRIHLYIITIILFRMYYQAKY
jgi:hypothetical protein